MRIHFEMIVSLNEQFLDVQLLNPVCARLVILQITRMRRHKNRSYCRKLFLNEMLIRNGKIQGK